MLLVPLLLAAPAFHGFDFGANLTAGFQPSSIVWNRRFDPPVLYVGDANTGEILAVTIGDDGPQGMSSIVAAGDTGAFGLLVTRERYLVACHGKANTASVIDTADPSVNLTITLMPSDTSAPSAIVDVTYLDSQSALFFINSHQNEMYKVGVSEDANGQLVLGSPEVIAYSSTEGDLYQGTEPNAAAVEVAPDGAHLLVVSAVFFAVFKVDPVSGVASAVLGSERISGPSDMKICPASNRLYIVNSLTPSVLVFDLDEDLLGGHLVKEIVGGLDGPSSMALYGPIAVVANGLSDVSHTPETVYPLSYMDLEFEGVGCSGCPQGCYPEAYMSMDRRRSRRRRSRRLLFGSLGSCPAGCVQLFSSAPAAATRAQS